MHSSDITVTFGALSGEQPRIMLGSNCLVAVKHDQPINVPLYFAEQCWLSLSKSHIWRKLVSSGRRLLHLSANFHCSLCFLVGTLTWEC